MTPVTALLRQADPPAITAASSPVVAYTHQRAVAGGSGLPAPLLPDDWDVLFSAVVHRLTDASAAGLAAPGHATVWECVQALKLLHVALGRERAAYRRAERVLREHG